MKLVCSVCCKTMEASSIARYMHPEEKEERVKDADGHHIAISSDQRTWCDGEWLEYVDYDNGGIPFGGGVVGLTRWTLTDGRVLERRYDSRKGGYQPARIWSDMAACYKGVPE